MSLHKGRECSQTFYASDSGSYIREALRIPSIIRLLDRVCLYMPHSLYLLSMLFSRVWRCSNALWM